LRRCRVEQLMQSYKIPKFDTVNEFLVHVAQKRGRLKRGGGADLDAAARTVLQDWNGGRISFYTEPPQGGFEGVHISAEIVNQWGKEFDFEQVLHQEQSDTIDRLQQDLPNIDQVEMSSEPLVSTNSLVLDDEMELEDECTDVANHLDTEPQLSTFVSKVLKKSQPRSMESAQSQA